MHASTQEALNAGASLDPLSTPSEQVLRVGIANAADALVVATGAGLFYDAAREVRETVQAMTRRELKGVRK